MDRSGADWDKARRTTARRPVFEAAGRLRRALAVKSLNQNEVDELFAELRLKEQRQAPDDD